MTDPLISIIIPIYNSEKYLRTCLDSIITQTYTNWEAILVDDGSKDNCGQICDEYAKKDGRFLVVHKDNGGVASARQTGTDNAKGEYIIHVDPDDRIDLNMLEDMLNIISDDTDILVVDFFIDNNGTSTYSKQADVSSSDELLKAILENRCMGSLCNKLIRSSLYKETTFSKDLYYCEDVYILAQILLRNHSLIIKNYHQAYYHYIQHPKSITNTYSEESFNSYMSFLDKLECLLEDARWEYKDIIPIKRQDFFATYINTGVFSFCQMLLRYNMIKKDNIHHPEYLKQYLNNKKHFYISLFENSSYFTRIITSLMLWTKKNVFEYFKLL